LQSGDTLAVYTDGVTEAVSPVDMAAPQHDDITLIVVKIR